MHQSHLSLAARIFFSVWKLKPSERKQSDVKRNHNKQKPTSHNWLAALQFFSVLIEFKKLCILCSNYHPQTRHMPCSPTLGASPPPVKICFVSSAAQPRCSLQHARASALLPVPAREFEQWERGLRLSDKPRGKHILFSSYCLSLPCIVL